MKYKYLYYKDMILMYIFYAAQQKQHTLEIFPI